MQQLHQQPAIVRLLALLAIVALFWLPVAIPLSWQLSDSNQVTILTMGWLFIVFVVVIQGWGRWVHGDPQILRTYGLVLTPEAGKEGLLGLAIGFSSLLLLVGVESALGWIQWQQPSLPVPRLILEGAITGLGVGLAEELVFRGWILDELQRDYSYARSLWITSLLFALLHFLKPIAEIWRTFPQFPALVLLGLALVWAKRSTSTKTWFSHRLTLDQGRLALPIGLHGGLVWSYYILNVGQLTQPSGQIPAWITGIDQNPLAGLMGVIGIGSIAIGMYRRCHARPSRSLGSTR